MSDRVRGLLLRLNNTRERRTRKASAHPFRSSGSVNPGSVLASKKLKEGFDVAGNDIRIGADVLVRAALSDEFASASGQYLENDAGRFTPPRADALDPQIAETIMWAIEERLQKSTAASVGRPRVGDPKFE